MFPINKIWAYLCEHARFAHARTLKYRNYFGVSQQLVRSDIIVSIVEELDKISGSISDKRFTVGHIKLCW